MSPCLEAHGDNLLLYVRLAPNAAQNKINAPYDDGSGQQRLKISVTTVPEDGKANKALIKLLSKALKLPKSGIELVAGHTDRNKKLSLPDCADRLSEFQNHLGL